jgi:hypothetical protein
LLSNTNGYVSGFNKLEISEQVRHYNVPRFLQMKGLLIGLNVFYKLKGPRTIKWGQLLRNQIPGNNMLNKPISAINTITTREIVSSKTVNGPILMPSLESAKNRINPAPAAGIGPSDDRLRLDFGMLFPRADYLESLNPNRF